MVQTCCCLARQCSIAALLRAMALGVMVVSYLLVFQHLVALYTASMLYTLYVGVL